MKPTLYLLLSSMVVCAASSAATASCGSLGQILPADNAWNTDISTWPVHPNSANYVNSIGTAGALHPDFGTIYPPGSGIPWGMPYGVVHAGEPLVPIHFTAYGSESDPGPYPMPLGTPIEGGSASAGDRHVIAVDVDGRKLYELYNAAPDNSAGQWDADSGAVYDLTSDALRPAGWTSADAAGLPIFPGLIRHDEVACGAIDHAIRFTVQNSQAAYIFPARHFASSSQNPNLPPMGLRLRLKASVDISAYPTDDQVILTALKRYGMILADNGSNWFISGAPDPGWNDSNINLLKQIHGSDFEVVDTTGAAPMNPSVPLPATAQSDFSAVKVYPNPWRKDKHETVPLTFANLPLGSTVKLFTISGRKVKTLETSLDTAAWDLKNESGDPVASGVYVYLITLNSNGDEQKMRGKVAVIK